MWKFFDRIDRWNLEIAWGPHGDWKEKGEKVEEICNDLKLIHIVDIMCRGPVSDQPIAYARLYGLNEREYDYDYSDDELRDLAEKLEDLAEDHEVVYCLFNNYEMYDNAQKLMEIL